MAKPGGRKYPSLSGHKSFANYPVVSQSQSAQCPSASGASRLWQFRHDRVLEARRRKGSNDARKPAAIGHRVRIKRSVGLPGSSPQDCGAAQNDCPIRL
jgi:hypothetical protein